MFKSQRGLIIELSSTSPSSHRYDSGDDNMKKIIGEAMMKSRQEKNQGSKSSGGGGGGGFDSDDF